MSFNKAKEAHEKLMSERKEVSVINKYQEALNKITPTTSNYDLIAATKTMQELVDKEIAMKPDTEVDYDNRRFIYCGKCGEDIGENWNYCGYCGTEIDWSDEE